jgi:hypothetical protein
MHYIHQWLLTVIDGADCKTTGKVVAGGAVNSEG